MIVSRERPSATGAAVGALGRIVPAMAGRLRPTARRFTRCRRQRSISAPHSAATIAQTMYDAAKDFEASFILPQLDQLRAVPILRVPGTGREPDLSERQLDARRRVQEAMETLCGIGSRAGSCIWHVIGLQRGVREWSMRQGWGGRPVRRSRRRAS